MKIKQLKIINQDESTEIADIGADAINVDYNDSTVKAELDKLNNNVDTNTTNISSEIATRANAITNLQSQIRGLASGSPKGSYANAAAIVSANPATGVYIAQDNGHIYSWTKDASSAIDLGVYQATDIAHESIDFGSLNKELIQLYLTTIGIDDLYLHSTMTIYQGGYTNSQGCWTTSMFLARRGDTFTFDDSSTLKLRFAHFSLQDGSFLGDTGAYAYFTSYTIPVDCFLIIGVSDSTKTATETEIRDFLSHIRGYRFGNSGKRKELFTNIKKAARRGTFIDGKYSASNMNRIAIDAHIFLPKGTIIYKMVPHDQMNFLWTKVEVNDKFLATSSWMDTIVNVIPEDGYYKLLITIHSGYESYFLPETDEIAAYLMEHFDQFIDIRVPDTQQHIFMGNYGVSKEVTVSNGGKILFEEAPTRDKASLKWYKNDILMIDGKNIYLDNLMEEFPSKCFIEDNYINIQLTGGEVFFYSISKERCYIGSLSEMSQQRWDSFDMVPLFIRRFRNASGLLYQKSMEWYLRFTKGVFRPIINISGNHDVGRRESGSDVVLSIQYDQGIYIHNQPWTSATFSESNKKRFKSCTAILEEVGDTYAAHVGTNLEITIPVKYAFTYDPQKDVYSVELLYTMNSDKIVLYYNYYNNDAGIFWDKYWTQWIRTLSSRNSSDYYNIIEDETIANKISTFSNKINTTTSTNIESFLFFTDPHLLGYAGSMNYNTFYKYMGNIKQVYNNTPTDFIVSGGDWLNAQDTQEQAIYKLGQVDAYMHKNFKNYYCISGNHDCNYQGKLTSDSEDNTGRLNDTTRVNLWYRDYKKSYYYFDGKSSRNYIFDTEIDWNTSMNDFKWAQINWFCTDLIETDKPHNTIIAHIIYNTGAQGSGQITPMATTLGQIIEAYNSHASLTLNNKTYNFSNCTGRIDYVLSGHRHYDESYTLGGIPSIVTENVQKTAFGSFECILADYDNHKLYVVGFGETRPDRVFDI